MWKVRDEHVEERVSTGCGSVGQSDSGDHPASEAKDLGASRDERGRLPEVGSDVGVPLGKQAPQSANMSNISEDDELSGWLVTLMAILFLGLYNSLKWPIEKILTTY